MEAFQHIWDGTEPGWEIQRTYEHSWSLVFTFPPGGPTVSQAVALRRLFPELQNQPAAEFLRSIRQKQALTFSVAFMQFFEIGDKALALGLPVEHFAQTNTTDLLVNAITHQTLHMEDEHLSGALVRRAQAEGVPIREIEVD